MEPGGNQNLETGRGVDGGGGKLTERRYVWPLILVTSLFLLWAVGVNLNDILIPHLKRLFGLTDFQSSFIQVAFFGGYFLAAWPAGWVVGKLGYQRGIICGLLICAVGAFLFLPAASVHVYAAFLAALFIMACGQSFLEVSANPYVTFLGPPETAERRLNTAQSFNALGSVLTPVFGAWLILSRAHKLAGTAPPAQVEAAVVRLPYLIIVAIFLCMAVLIGRAHLPRISEEPVEGAPAVAQPILGFPHLVKGVLAQFFYVGAQVGVASFVIRFVEFAHPGTSDVEAANYLKLHLLAFMIGRFGGSALMKRFRPAAMLATFAAGSLVSVAMVLLSRGPAALAGIVLLGFFHSIMFPTIFALSIRHLGPATRKGSSLLVMAIIGGAFFPAIMGRISDATSIRMAFLVPLACYCFVLYFGGWGYRVKGEARV
ncbi:MAG TPA: L-fucose:H+ symporter permease [Acidobacteriaceae bacterium]|nr:L-fucose:H+ symporter permease [Acidobacteriaceae bacterium]